MINKHKPFSEEENQERKKQKHEDPIQRLLNEQKQDKELLKEIKNILDLEKEIHGLSVIGGLKALIKKYHEEKEKVFKLKSELDKQIRTL